MQQRTLGGTGLQVSPLGFGAATLGDEYGKADSNEAERAVHHAIAVGVNLFDVAPYYGRTLAETRLGNYLKGRRDKVILATKCARYDIAGFDFSAERITRSVDESLQRLQTDYVDIMHVHDVEFGDKRQIVDETIPALRKAQAAGKARFIGITGLALKMLREIAAETPVDCILSYCRYNLLNRDLDRELSSFTRANNIGLLNASPLHMRCLSEAGPPPWHPAPPAVKQAAQDVVELCRTAGASAPLIALQFALRHPSVASTFVGISNVAEVDESLKALESEPDPELLVKIETIVSPVQGSIWVTGKPENH